VVCECAYVSKFEARKIWYLSVSILEQPIFLEKLFSELLQSATTILISTLKKMPLRKQHLHEKEIELRRQIQLLQETLNTQLALLEDNKSN